MILYSFAGTEGFTRRMMNQIDPMIGIRLMKIQGQLLPMSLSLLTLTPSPGRRRAREIRRLIMLRINTITGTLAKIEPRMLKTSPIRKSTRAYCQNSARSARPSNFTYLLKTTSLKLATTSFTNYYCPLKLFDSTKN